MDRQSRIRLTWLLAGERMRARGRQGMASDWMMEMFPVERPESYRSGAVLALLSKVVDASLSTCLVN